jgi:hypothetical protein
MSHEDESLQNRRIAYWGEAHLGSTSQSYKRAKQFASKGDYFTAYL